MEYVDIVDENDNVIGKASKQEAHEQGLLHRTVIALIKNSSNDFILIQQAPDKQDAGQFVCPVGGHVEVGESEEDALKREALEECGLVDFEFKLIGKTIFNREIKGRRENHYFILYEIFTDVSLILNEESVSYESLSSIELENQIKFNSEKFGPPFHFLMKKFYPHLIS